jgi:hypothetical protein
MGREMEKVVLGEFRDSTLIYEENDFGGILFWGFLKFYSCIHVGALRRGGTSCFFWVLGEFYLVN